MASVKNTAFEIRVSNLTNDKTINVSGYYKINNAGTLEDDICPSGFLCIKNSLTANKGYEGKGAGGTDILNGNTWNFTLAANGKAGGLGDRTEIYAFNSYNVDSFKNRDQLWRLGINTLGLELPEGERGTFSQIIIGDQYKFGAGNFTTVPTSALKYIAVVNGLFVASATAPTAGDGLYFEYLYTENFTEGNMDADFVGYNVVAKRA